MNALELSFFFNILYVEELNTVYVVLSQRPLKTVTSSTAMTPLIEPALTPSNIRRFPITPGENETL